MSNFRIRKKRLNGDLTKSLARELTQQFERDIAHLQKEERDRVAGIPPGYVIQLDTQQLIKILIQKHRQPLSEYFGHLFDRNTAAASISCQQTLALFQGVFLEVLFTSCISSVHDFIQSFPEKFQWNDQAKGCWDELTERFVANMRADREIYEWLPQFLKREESYVAVRNTNINREIDAISEIITLPSIVLYKFPPLLVQRRQEIVDEFLTHVVDIFPNESQTIFSLNVPIPYLPQERSPHEEGITERIVGGCGLHLEQQEAKPSLKGRELIETHLAQILTLEPESFLCATGREGSKQVIFRLELENLDPKDVGDYRYLEKTLLAPQEETIDQWEKRVELEKAMEREDRESFEHLLDSMPDAVHWYDRGKKTLLHQAASLSDPFYVQKLLANGASQNTPDAQGYLPIHYAAMKNHSEVLQILMNSTAVNATSHNGTTPLIVAIQHRQAQAVRLLLAQGGHLSSLAGGYTALHSALHEGDDAVLAAFFDSTEVQGQINVCSYEGGTPLMLACQLENIAWASKLLELGADPHIARLDGVTALEVAIRRRFFPIIKKVYLATKTPSSLALKAAAEVGDPEVFALMLPHLYSYRNLSGDTALHIACCEGNLKGALYLIEHCSDLAFLALTNQEKQMPSTLAAIFSFWEIIEALWHRGALLDLKQLFIAQYNPLLVEITRVISLSPTQLHDYATIAAQAGNVGALSFIFKPRGVCLEKIAGPNGWSLLHYLAKYDGLFLFQQEITRATDLRQPLTHDRGKTLAAIAAESGSYRVLKALLLLMKKRGVSLEAAENDRHLLVSAICGHTDEIVWQIFGEKLPANGVLDEKGSRAVHIAAQIGSLEALERLIEKGADLNVLDHRGWGALDYAVSLGLEKVVQLLLTKGCRVTANALYLASLLPHEALFSSMIIYNKEADVLDEALIRTIEKGSLHGFRRLCARNASLKTQSREGWTPTLRASMLGQNEILVEIVCKEVGPDERTYAGRKPLDWAIWEGHECCIEVLHRAGYKETLSLEEKTECEEVKNRRNQFIAETNTAITKKKLKYLVPSLKTEMKEEPVDKDYNTIVHALVKELINDNSTIADTLMHMFDETASIPWKKEDLIRPNRLGITALHVAACGAPEPVFREILDCFDSQKDLALLETTDSKGRTPLFHAVLKGNEENVRLLLDRGVSLTHRDFQLSSPLSLACQFGVLEMVRMLLEKGADPNQWVEKNHSFPLHVAVRAQKPQIVQILLAYGAKTHLVDGAGNTILSEAMQTRCSSFIRIFGETTSLVNGKTQEGQDCRHLAAISGNPEMLQAVLSTDLEDVEAPCLVHKNERIPDYEITLLGSACKGGNVETTAWLLAHGADPSPKNPHFLRPFRLAAKHPKALSLFPLFEAFRIAHDPDQLFVAISDAISQDHVASICALYPRGIPIDSFLSNGETGLHLACRSGALHCTAWLLEQGASPFLPTESGIEVLELAAKNSSFHQFRLLVTAIQDKVDLNRVNDRGETYMHLAAGAGNLAHVLVLMQFGAHFHQIDNMQQTPLHVAARQGHSEIVRLFLACGEKDEQHSMRGQLAKDLVKSNDRVTQEVFALFNSLELVDLQTSLHCAVRSGSILAVRFLTHVFSLDKINQQDAQGCTALHIAVKAHQQESVLTLIQGGAKVDSIDNIGRTPLWLACVEEKKNSLARLLIGAGADVNYVHPSGQTLMEHLEADPLLVQIMREAECLNG